MASLSVAPLARLSPSFEPFDHSVEGRYMGRFVLVARVNLTDAKPNIFKSDILHQNNTLGCEEKIDIAGI